jgi:dTDP-glucose 4,6-dehydratase
MRRLQNILVTGGAGFIGSNFISYALKETDFKGRIINLDKLTYAGNLENLDPIDRQYGGKRYFFEKWDIQDHEAVKQLILKYDIDTIVHFAAESHVDRSIFGPGEFVRTNIHGTFSLLEVVRELWKGREDVLFHHVSTDEVYGSLGETGYFRETTAYDPRSPYSASKAASDHLVNAYFHTYGLPITMSNCSNNYGPHQFPEKLLPLMILNMMNGKPLPVYGDGRNVRDWLYVDDHNGALWMILNSGRTGETYNIGGENEWENIKLLHVLCEKMAKAMSVAPESLKALITHIEDRSGHDRRYAINCDKIKTELGWRQKYTFDQGLDKTIDWYLSNQPWIEHVVNGSYKNWIDKNYAGR